MRHTRTLLAVALLTSPLHFSGPMVQLAAAAPTRSGDASIDMEPGRWILATRHVRRVIAITAGHFQETQRVQGQLGTPGLTLTSDGFSVELGDVGMVHGGSGGWTLRDSRIMSLKQGELQLTITLERQALQITKNYVLYPFSSVIREWITLANVGATPLQISDPGFLDLAIRTPQPTDTRFCWLSGGASVWGSWRLYQQPLVEKERREFDTYDPFPVPDDIVDHLPGNGTQARILHNDKQIWPTQEKWQVSLHSQAKSLYDLKLDVQAGDRIVFIANSRGNATASGSYYAPVIKDSTGKLFLSWAHYSKTQGQQGWSYYYYDGDQLRELVNVPGANICLTSNKNGCWVKDPDNPMKTPRIGWNYVQPDTEHDVARIWTAEKKDSIQITGDFSNGWNYCGGSEQGPKGGSASYAPWYAYHNTKTGDGIFIGWDYFGRWNAVSERRADHVYHQRLKVMNYRRALMPGESVTTPKAFVGQFHGDIDDAGNACLDWQYRYLWDYTRGKWFPAIRMLGAWLRGCGINPDVASTYRKVFRVVDLMRYCGGDVYHRDWGWWRRLGDWDGPDWKTANQYLNKHGMGLLLYGTTNYAERDSRIGQAVSDGFTSTNARYELDVSKPAVVDAVVAELTRWEREYGTYTWRNDGGFLAPHTPDDTNVLAQDQGFRRIIQTFLDKNPACAFQSVNNGGTLAGYEYTRFSSATSFSDGDVGILRNHWASLMLPPDKTSNFPEKSQAFRYDKSSWRSMLAYNVDISQDTTDPDKMEGIRELIDIYHYLYSQQVVGRWVKVYRPVVIGDTDQTMYFQRLSGDALRGVILPKKPVTQPVTIHPKGLIADAQYTVTFHESQRQLRQHGAVLMRQGIVMAEILPGEIIYLNLPYHPGNRRDKEPPVAARQVELRQATNMGYPGVEISWQAGLDNQWLSHYLVYRDGHLIDKVAKGTFYFDHSLGADLAANYAIATVDGAGNLSPQATAARASQQRLTIYDDASEVLDFSAQWQPLQNDHWAHHNTITRAQQAGAVLKFDFTGHHLTWFTRLGPDCGIAEITVAGHTETVDTYSADAMWGIAVWQRQFDSAGPHQVTLKVLGTHGRHASDVNRNEASRRAATWVYVDGFRVADKAAR